MIVPMIIIIIIMIMIIIIIMIMIISATRILVQLLTVPIAIFGQGVCKDRFPVFLRPDFSDS